MVVAQDTPQDIAQEWLSRVQTAIDNSEPNQLADCLLTNGWLRDILVFGWDRRSLEGRQAALRYLQDEGRLKLAGIHNMVLDEEHFTKPGWFQALPNKKGVELIFRFKTRVFHGVGTSVLFPDDEGVWKAFHLNFVAQDIIGHEEAGNPSGDYMKELRTYEEARLESVSSVEADPYALVVGAGHCGLFAAARFKQMGIPTLVIEQYPNVGDNWRRRYPSLTLHTPRAHHEMLYAPYPKTWPTFTPRDKLADWFEQYAKSQELVIWTSSKVVPTPVYDPISGRWTVMILRGNKQVTVKPAHIVLATGFLGEPQMPELPGLDHFKGTLLHSERFPGGAQFKGKHVVVVGSSNAAVDVCQDLHYHGAASILMIQRAPTTVTSARVLHERVNRLFHEGRPQEVNDLKAHATPMGLVKKLRIADQPNVEKEDAEMITGLEKAGYRYTSGPERQGGYALAFDRFGGIWIDVGCAQLIADGHIRVRQAGELSRITESSVLFSDGSELSVDAIIAATGYRRIREIQKGTFGAEVIDQTGPVWGLDDEGEVRGCWKPSGHPGLWYALGPFDFARFYSKPLVRTGHVDH